MRNKLKGTGVAIVTPFNDDGSIDFNSLKNLLEHLIANGVDYLVVQGTTGESVTLSQDEKREALSFVLEVNAGRLPVVLGIGGNNTESVIRSFDSFRFEGVDAILSVSPYYNKPAQQGVYLHYKALAEQAPCPIILYNVPGRTASNITADTTLRLASASGNIIAVKEASGNLEQIARIIRNRPDDFLIISGDDALTLPILSIGGDGVISVVANAFPEAFSSMVNSALQGDYAKARNLHLSILELIPLLFAEGNPAGIKAALKILGICSSDALRLPLTPISNDLYKQMEKAIQRLIDESGRL